MSQNTEQVAKLFIDFVNSRKWHEWRDHNDLSEEKRRIIFDLVNAAGFQPRAILRGVLRGWNVDQDGSKLDSFPFNNFPYYVVDQDGEEDFFATGWLDNAFSLAQSGGPSWEKRTLVEQLIFEIERSVPLEPIQLTPDGDMLLEYPPREHAFGYQYFVDHTKNDHVLGSCVGRHAYCGGWVDRHGATTIQHALVCRACGLRVLFPKEIKTYGELRQVLTHRFLIPT